MRLTYDEIESNMRGAFFEKCGENPDTGSFEEKVIEALASELYSLSCQGDYILKQSFVQTATGEYLDMLGEMRDCTRKGETKAIGTLKFYNAQASEEDIQISKGTVCSVCSKPYIQFETTEDAVISAGELSVEVPAQALAGGEEYNALAGEITVMVNAPVMVENVTNESEFSGGSDIESDSAFRKRIIKNYTIPANGIGKASIENKIEKLDYISDCRVLDAQSKGITEIVVRLNDGQSITADRTMEIRDCIGFADMAGLTVVIDRASVSSVNITVDLTISSMADKNEVSNFAKNVIEEIFSERKIGKSISVSKITKELLRNEDIYDVRFYSSHIVNGEFVCPSKAYLILSNLVVNCDNE
ncbi:MAG: baseplate J/gp47 family protein [Eubacterium sp.]